MAKGTKNYFRHSFSAHEDVKLQKFIDVVGPAGYLYFFTLCEIAAKQCTENDADPRTFKAKIHPRNLAVIWRTHRNKLGTFLTHSRDILGIFWECTENEVVYLIPNLWKYLGSYSSLSDKQKEIKGNKIKEKEIEPEKFSDDAIFLVSELKRLMLANNDKAKLPKNNAAWLKSASLLLGADGYGKDEAVAILKWSQENDFWKSNILSMPKFREKIGALKLQMERDYKLPKMISESDAAAALEAVFQ